MDGLLHIFVEMMDISMNFQMIFGVRMSSFFHTLHLFIKGSKYKILLWQFLSIRMLRQIWSIQSAYISILVIT